MADASTDARLRQVFNFDADELAANHLGRLTARQARAASAVLAARRQRMAIIWGVVGLAILLPIILSSVFDGAGPRSRQWTMFLPFALTMVLVAGGVLYETPPNTAHRTWSRRSARSRAPQPSPRATGALHGLRRPDRPVRFEFTPPEQQAPSRRLGVTASSTSPAHRGTRFCRSSHWLIQRSHSEEEPGGYRFFTLERSFTRVAPRRA
jgi:hypothetical protein